MIRRLAALTALALWFAALSLIGFVAVVDFRRGAAALTLVVLALWTAWQGLVRRRSVRVAALAAVTLLALIALVLLIAVRPAVELLAIGALVSGVAAGAYALRAHIPLPPASRPKRPVLFWNRWSGGGKAVRARLDEEARARGIKPVELLQGMDFREQMRDAVNSDADAVAVAGGDGSQAIGASIAAERHLPFACIPAGTRNHFALDVGVDRDDVVGALDAFVEGGERVIDLAEVNGHVFVNNVSIGVYGEAVQQAGYRGAKIRTLLETVPAVLSTSARPHLRWRSPDGREHDGAVAILVSNNPYQLGRGLAAGTRPRLDTGLLGITVLGVPGDEPGAWVWNTSTFEVAAEGAVNVGLDGEALVLESPLRFCIRPGALRCRIARHHPGASPSAFEHEGLRALITLLVRIAAGK